MKSNALIVVGLLALAAPSPAGDVGGGGAKLVYRGFTMDTRVLEQVGSGRQFIEQSLKQQVDLVARLPLRDDVMEFFKKVPIVVVNDDMNEPGRCDGKTVYLQGRVLPPDRVILMHELLHAYHNLVLPGGEQNPQVIAFYQSGLDVYPYGRQETFLSNPKEFFAITASIYMNGTIKRAPFTPQAIREAQPDYYQYLAGLFARPAPEVKARRKPR